LSGANTYSGVTTVSAGTLRIAKEVSLYNNNTASWTDAKIVVGSNATLQLNVGGTGEFTTGDLDILLPLGTATGGVRSGSAGAGDTSNAPSAVTYGTVIANTNGGVNVLNVNKLGATTLTLTGANTFTGTTTVSAGTLQLSGSGTTGAGPVSVVSGTLD